jgi:hypothetical protein
MQLAHINHVMRVASYVVKPPHKNNVHGQTVFYINGRSTDVVNVNLTVEHRTFLGRRRGVEPPHTVCTLLRSS